MAKDKENKLITDDIDFLKDKYRDETMHKNSLGEGDIAITAPYLNYDGLNIKINDNQNKFFSLPTVLEANIDRLLSAYKGRTIYNNMVIRLDDVYDDKGSINIITSRSTFYNSLMTNRMADYEFIEGVSVRELFEYGPKLSSFKNSKMSNHIGFNLMLRTLDGLYVFIERYKGMSIASGTVSVGVAASMKAKYVGDTLTEESFSKAVYMEAVDELGIKEEEDISFNIDTDIISLYRSLDENGKPNFLLHGEILLSSDELLDIFNSSIEDNDEEELIRDGNNIMFFDLNLIELENYKMIYDNDKVYKITPSVAYCISETYLKNRYMNDR